MAHTVEEKPTLVIVLAGEIDLANATEIGDRICAAMDGNDGRAVLVDCSEVGFFDSRGIAMLARVQRTFADAGRSVAWRGFSDHTTKVLRLLGVHDYLSIVE